MATSDDLLQKISDLAIDYDSSPGDDALPFKPNWHYEMLRVLQAIEYNQRIYNEMYRMKNGISINTVSS